MHRPRLAPPALPPAVAHRLRQAGVRVELRDADTALLHDVPLDPGRFNKTNSNLLIKRPAGGLPFVLGVDEDLEYRGGDARLVHAFAAGARRQGWRLLRLGGADGEVGAAVERALAALGFDGEEPALPPTGRAPGGLLAAFGEDLTAALPRLPATVGRAEQLETLLASLDGWRPRLPVVVGPPGAGKRQLLAAAAARLAAAHPSRRLLAVGLGSLFAGTMFDGERESLLAALLAESATQPGTLLALERLDLAVLDAPYGAFLLARALDQGVPLLGSTLPDLAAALRALPLAGRVVPVELAAAGRGRTLDVLRVVSSRVAEHHGVAIGESLLEPLLQRAAELPGCLPGKAVALLDAAAARARLAGAPELELLHVHLAAASGRPGR